MMSAVSVPEEELAATGCVPDGSGVKFGSVLNDGVGGTKGGGGLGVVPPGVGVPGVGVPGVGGRGVDGGEGVVVTPGGGLVGGGVGITGGEGVAGGDVAGRGVVGGDVAGGEVAGGEVAGGEVEGGEVAGGGVTAGVAAGVVGGSVTTCASTNIESITAAIATPSRSFLGDIRDTVKSSVSILISASIRIQIRPKCAQHVQSRHAQRVSRTMRYDISVGTRR
jgi:hypothetical protein